MKLFFKIGLLLILAMQSELVKLDETNTQESPVSLDTVTQRLIKDSRIKVLGAKTQIIAGKKIYLIKILTATGHLQYLKMDAATGKPLNTAKK